MVDYVIIDTAPVSADSSTAAIAKFAHKLLMVVRTDTVKVDVINNYLATLKDSGVDIAGCILNDLYQEIVTSNIFGAAETGTYYHHKYSKYGKDDRYGRYGKYGRYSKYLHASSYYKYTKNRTDRK